MATEAAWWNFAVGHCMLLRQHCARFAHRPGVRISVHLAIGTIFLWLFLRQVNLGHAISAAARAAILPLAIALFAYAVDFLLRAFRFWMLLQQASAQRLPWRAVPGPFIASFGISDLLPLRAGDVFRLLWFQRQMDLRPSIVLGSMMIERFLDLFALLLLALAILGWHLGDAWLLCLGLLALLGGGAAVLILVGTRLSGRADDMRWRWLAGLVAALGCFRLLRSPRLFLNLTGISLVCWLLEAVVLLGTWVALGGAIGQWIAPIAAFIASTLGTLFPGLPGHFGTFELFGLETFSRMGVAPDFAAAVLLLAHMLLWAPTALFAILWLMLNRSGKAAK